MMSITADLAQLVHHEGPLLDDGYRIYDEVIASRGRRRGHVLTEQEITHVFGLLDRTHGDETEAWHIGGAGYYITEYLGRLTGLDYAPLEA